MMGWYHDGLGWNGWLAMALMMLAFWALVVIGLVTLFRSVDRGGDVERADAMAILDERFARGEIDAAEYHARQDVLRGGLGPPAPDPARHSPTGSVGTA